MRGRIRILGIVLLVPAAAVAQGNGVTMTGDSVIDVRFVDVELPVVIRSLGRYLDRPVFLSDVPDLRVSFETPRPIEARDVIDILHGLLDTHGLVVDSADAFYRVRRRPDTSARRAAGSDGGALQAGNLHLFVHHLRHARASDVSRAIGLLFGINVSASARSELQGGTLSEELARSEPAGEPVPSQEPSSGMGPVTIVADDVTNALFIRSDSADYAAISNAVQRMDLRPLQVLIEVVIAEVRRDRLFSLGVDASVEDISVDAGDGALSGMLAGGGLADLVVRVMNLASFDLNAVLRAAVSRGDARIVSRPVVVAVNNREASILVGSQRPFVQVSRSLPTDTPTRDQVIQYRDVGTKLTVIPTINADGFVSLVLRQEASAATSETQFDAPVISTREIETELLVRDGQTIILGGMLETQHEVVKTGVPLLSALPVLGGLFGFQERRSTETELFLFITPQILGTDEQVDAATAEAIEGAEQRGFDVRRHNR